METGNEAHECSGRNVTVLVYMLFGNTGRSGS